MHFVILVGVILVSVIFLLRSKENKVKGYAGIALFISLLITLLFCIEKIPAGNVGVVDIFGTVKDKTLPPGLRIVEPWAKVIKYSTKTQELKEIMDVPSQEGLNVRLEISVLYHLDSDKAANVYKTVGTNYQDVILIPQFRSVARGVTASYDAKALYTSAREELSKKLTEMLQEQVSNRGLTIESTPLRSITLPDRLRASIEDKLQVEQESQRMEFILTKEKQEAERRRIEAQGIADFQAIVSKGIDDKLLKWKGIEATEKLANSTNTKVIVIGGEGGLPLIMDTSK